MLHQIGVGALGPVFRTYEPTRDRLVAVKVFRLDITPEQSQALADELAGAADAGLSHPSVVEPIASGMEGTLAYRAEEYVAAESLDVAMRHYAPAPIEKVLPLITQLAGAIEFARTAGVGHGALHPRDIFMTPDEARATGFGVVEALERVGLRAPVRRPYSAPERVAGRLWNTTADVFSLGVIAYEMLTARRPAGTGAQIEPLTGPNADAIHTVLAQAMDDDPVRRFPTALSFASALEAASRGETIVDTAAAGASVAALPLAVEHPDDLLAANGADADVDEFEEPVDEVKDPVLTEWDNRDFISEEPGVDDISAERDDDDISAEREDDDGHFALGSEERETEDAASSVDLFDPEAIEDLALEQLSTERFADEFGAAAAAGDSRASFDEPESDAVSLVPLRGEDDDEDRQRAAPFAAPVVVERPGPAILPVALALLVGLLIGYAGGYAVTGRDSGTEPAAATPSDAAAAAKSGPRAEAGKAYSEQKVAGAPAVPPVTTGASAASTGRLVVNSTPKGASVTLDGRLRGRTPLTLDKLPLRAFVVRIVQPGFLTARQDVTLSPRSSSRTLTFRLTPARGVAPAARGRQDSAATGSLYVASRPAGARVFVDGRPAGVTPLLIPNLRSGSHAVRLELDSHVTWTTSVRVSAGQWARIIAPLDRAR